MVIVRLAPKKRAALICFKVKQASAAVHPSVPPSALVFRSQPVEGGGELGSGVAFKARNVHKPD